MHPQTISSPSSTVLLIVYKSVLHRILHLGLCNLKGGSAFPGKIFPPSSTTHGSTLPGMFDASHSTFLACGAHEGLGG